MKRTASFPDISKRLEHIEGKGILYGAFTSQDPVYYYTIHEPKLALEAYQILHDGFYHSIIDEENIKQAKEPVIDELKKAERNSFNILWNLANRGLWPNSSLAHRPLGTEETIQSIEESDVYSFQKKYYTDNNLTILFLTPDSKILARITDKIKPSTKDGDLHTLERKIEKKFSRSQNLILKNKASNFVQIAFSFRTQANKNKEEVAALRFIKNYLAGGWISRLNERLRVQDNITYHVDGYIRDFPDTGTVRFIFSTRKQNLKHALGIFNEEIYKLKSQNIPQLELEKHKNASRIGILTHSLDPQSLLWYYGWTNLTHNGSPTSIGEFLEDINKLDPQTIKRVAKKHLNNTSIVGIGDINESDLRQ